MQRFKALEDFECEVTRSQYVKGLTYTIRPGNEDLLARCRKWRDDDRIEFQEEQGSPSAEAAGRGGVS